jgi:hypothetical protein
MTDTINKALPVLLMVLGCAFSTLLAAPNYQMGSEPNARKIRVVLLESSTISINGKSNINQFTCINTEPICQYSQEINYKEDAQCLFFENTYLKISSNTFDCGIRKLTEDFKELVQADKFPILEITLHTITNTNQSIMSSLTIGIAGAYKAVHMPIVMDKTDSIFKVKGSIALNISEFGLQAPTKLFGMIKVDEIVKIDFELHIAEQRIK